MLTQHHATYKEDYKGLLRFVGLLFGFASAAENDGLDAHSVSVVSLIRVDLTEESGRQMQLRKITIRSGISY